MMAEESSVVQFMPHGNCFVWQSDILGLHLFSDSLIAASYFSIPLALLYFLKKGGRLPFKLPLFLFSAFIFACGITHLLNIWTIWNPDYYLDGAVKLLTALISLATAVLLWPLVHKALHLPNLFALQEANKTLEAEVAQRKRVEQDLLKQKHVLSQTNLHLSNMNRLMSGRETKMIDLKREINELSGKLGRTQPYQVEGS